jgi:hypothetical protein
MATTKVSATLEQQTLTAIRTRVGPRGVSSYLEQAAREKLERDERRQRIRAYLAELDAEDPISGEERDQARRLVDGILQGRRGHGRLR